MNVVDLLIGAKFGAGGSGGSSGGGTSLEPLDNPAHDEHILEGREAYDEYGGHMEGTIPIRDVSKTEYVFDKGNPGIVFAAGYRAKDITARIVGESKEVTPSADGFTVEPTEGKVLTEVIVKGDTNLAQENIKSGVTIFGVDGKYEGEPTEGVTLLPLDNPASAGHILSGRKAYNDDGEEITGTIPVREFPTSLKNRTFVHNGQYYITLNADFPGTSLMSKNQYYTFSVFPMINPEEREVTPSADDIVITPGTTERPTLDGNRTAVARVMTKVTVKGDANLKQENIKSGVTIFGVEGKYEGEATGGGSDQLPALVEGSLTSVSSDQVTKVDQYAFYNRNGLTAVSFPNAVSVGQYAFNGCSALKSVSLPSVTSVGIYSFTNCTGLKSIELNALTTARSYMFAGCSSLETASLASATELESGVFSNCTALTTVNLGAVTTFRNQVFSGCENLTSLTIGTGSLVTYPDGLLDGTPIKEDGIGYIYVPANLVDSYKSASGWSTYANQIQAIPT